MKQLISIAFILILLCSCDSSTNETHDPYKIVIGFSSELNNYTSGKSEADDLGRYLSWIYFENEGYSVSVSDISEVIYNIPTIANTEVLTNESGEAIIRTQHSDGTVTEWQNYGCLFDNELLIESTLPGSCSAPMTAQGLATFTFIEDHAFQLDLDITAFYAVSNKEQYYNVAESGLKTIPISINFEDYTPQGNTLYICINIDGEVITQTDEVDFVPEARVICQ